MTGWLLALVVAAEVYRFGVHDVRRFQNDRANRAGNAMLREVQTGMWG